MSSFKTKKLPLFIFAKLPLAIIALFLISLVALPIGFYSMALYLEPKLPSLDEIKKAHIEMPLHIYSHDDKLIGIYGKRMSLPITYDEIPENMINALLAAEDASFFEHTGISVKGLGRAITQLLTKNADQTGGSTITMQVAKNYFLSFDQTFQRKITELFLSRRIESELNKSEIMTLYVNKIYLGEGAYGVKAAARRYFSKSLENLSIAEYAMIAGLPKAPSKFNPVINPERALTRRNWILGRMLHHKFISQDEYDVAITTPLQLNLYADKIDTEIPYIAEMARFSLTKQFGKEVMTSGWRVKLTVDSKVQKKANSIVRKHITNYDNRRKVWRGVESVNANLNNFKPYLDMHPVKIIEVNKRSLKAFMKSGKEIEIPWSGIRWAARSTRRIPKLFAVGNVIRVSPHGDSWRLVQPPEVQGSLVSINPQNGAIVALVGGYHYNQSKFNRATDGYRQPGSTIKPLIYAAALEKGYTPNSIISDSPLRIGSWHPKNSDGRYYGDMELRRALYLSRNLVSIRLLRDVGTQNALNLLEKFGLDKKRLPTTLSLSLGAGGASPLQMATAYASFANGGFRVQPYLIDQIYDFNNKVLFQANPKLACASCFNNNLEKINKNQTIIKEAMVKAELQRTQSLEELLQKNKQSVVDLEEKLAALANEENQEPADTPVINQSNNKNKPKDKKEKEEVTKKIENILDATPQHDRLLAYPVQYQYADQATRILSKNTALNMADILRDVIRVGTAKKARALGRSDIGGKTGTTNNFKDAWFAGFQPTNTTVVWMGFDKPKSLGRGQFGGRLALPVWMDFMRYQLKDTPVKWVTPKKKQKADNANKKKNEKEDKENIKDTSQTQNDKSTKNKPSKTRSALADSFFEARIQRRIPTRVVPTNLNENRPLLPTSQDSNSANTTNTENTKSHDGVPASIQFGGNNGDTNNSPVNQNNSMSNNPVNNGSVLTENVKPTTVEITNNRPQPLTPQPVPQVDRQPQQPVTPQQPIKETKDVLKEIDLAIEEVESLPPLGQ